MHHIKQGLGFGCGFFVIALIFLLAAIPLIYLLNLLLAYYVRLVP